ncbi:MAG: DUF177 domain-containing protein [Clostridia bacterium]|nr:DUF177 domain-containing protein [Clostridia bacterium]
MIVDIKSLDYGVPTVFEEVVTDKDRLTALLGAEPVGEFNIKAKCVLDDEGLVVRLSAKGECYARCDRCGEATIGNCFCDFTETLTEGDKEFDYLTERYDLTGLVDECIVLSAPRATLCKEDCKGLCPVCGGNLNKTSCDCKVNQCVEANPFSVLQDILLTGGAKNGSTKK